MIHQKANTLEVILLILIFVIWAIFIIKFPGHTYDTAFNYGYGFRIASFIIRCLLQITIIITGFIVLRLVPNYECQITKYGSRTLTVYLLHALIVLPFAYLIFPPLNSVPNIGVGILMIVLPTICCLLLFEKHIDRIFKKLMFSKL